MHFPDIDVAIHTDSSEISCGATDGKNLPGGKWIEEKRSHINYLEGKAISLAVKSYRRYWLGKKRIQVKSDNIIVISYIDDMGKYVS